MTDTNAFRGLTLRTQYGPQDEPLTTFYVPVLAAATTYDRAVGYFNSRELVYAARGVAPFVAAGGSMRLIVGAELSEADVLAVTEGKPLEDVLAEKLTADPFGEGVDIVEEHYLQLLSYLARKDRLQIRVGVPLDTEGRPLTYGQSQKYFHTKYGILTDPAGEKIAFVGSNNDTGPGWQGNHETFSVYPSWKFDGLLWPEYGAPLEADFDALWEGSAVAGWRTFDLPDAVQQRLIEFAEPDCTPSRRDPALPDEPHPTPIDVEAARARLKSLRDAPTEDGGTFVGVVTAPVDPLPHQLRIVHRAVTTYPRSYLLADEVGLGKTIEAGLIVRELTLSERASRALILVPASVMEQWQEELWEKLALPVPRYDGKKFWNVDKTEIEQPPGTQPWNAFPIVLASSHLARRKARRTEILDAGPWDIVLVDEAHHARRRGSKATDTPNSLLSLLMDMRDKRSWKALYLASATPMQMNAHEAWDLISLFNLPGKWAEDASWFTAYYRLLRQDPRTRDWTTLTRMVRDYLAAEDTGKDLVLVKRAKETLGWGRSKVVTDMDKLGMSSATAATLTPTEVDLSDEWLRRHTPMRDRVFRTTRQTMRDYQHAGILGPDVTIPVRHVDDVFIPLSDAEKKMYRRIEDYISTHYNAYMQTQQKALGFIMTVYRRRLTSSFEAIRQSLQRRLHALEGGLTLTEMLDDDDRRAVEDAPTLTDEHEQLEATTAELIADEIGELRDFLHSIERLTFDSKTDRLIKDIAASMNTHNTVVVFTQYTDTMDYLRDQLAQNYNRIACYSGRGGELWNPDTQKWEPIPKAKLKAMFREGKDIKILLGTDSMSEGLNLQTSARLINVDMPWNFMRVEQRIGRVDRIGGHPVVEVSNYFYSGTVEEQVYAGIAEDYDWFTDIVGDAQPVLSAVENAMSTAAMASPDTRDAAVAAQVQQVTDAVEAAKAQDVKISDFSDTTVEPPPELNPAATLEQIRDELTTNPLTAPKLVADPERDGVYALNGDTDRLVAFDRDTVENGDVAIELVTYGTQSMTELLNA